MSEIGTEGRGVNIDCCTKILSSFISIKLLAGMFLGMTCCLPIAMRMEEVKLKKTNRIPWVSNEDVVTTPLLQNGGEHHSGTGSLPQSMENHYPEWRKASMVTIPAFLNVAASVLMNIGLLSVTASVYQMLRGAQMLFAAFLAVVFLKRRLNLFHIVGMMCCLAGILIVGISSIAQSNHNGGVDYDRAIMNPGKSSPKQVVVGMLLIILAQGIQAMQLTFEDYFMVSVHCKIKDHNLL